MFLRANRNLNIWITIISFVVVLKYQSRSTMTIVKGFIQSIFNVNKNKE